MSDSPRPTPTDEYQDPLQNYDPPEYGDALEEALGERPVSDMQAQPSSSINKSATVREALQQLSEMHHACLLVEDEGKLVGVVSDRDVLNHVALELPGVLDQPVSSIMTTDPIRVLDTDSAAAALAVMANRGYRHVPVVDIENNIRGIVSPQRVTAFLWKHSQPSG